MAVEIPEGYKLWTDMGTDPFEDLAGPFHLKPQEDGTHKCAFISDPKHANMGGMIHGGLLMTFADYALFAIARDCLGEAGGVTISFNSEFVSAGPIGALIEASGEIVKVTGSMVFVRGKIYTGEQTILSFSGIIKKLRSR
ncbi:PaaI family thioesterase [Kordiimonas sp. SCSIO 12610]|nr:PaaI family thioesterase [Kordiimonas sp. SCSIO 12610]